MAASLSFFRRTHQPVWGGGGALSWDLHVGPQYQESGTGGGAREQKGKGKDEVFVNNS